MDLVQFLKKGMVLGSIGYRETRGPIPNGRRKWEV